MSHVQSLEVRRLFAFGPSTIQGISLVHTITENFGEPDFPSSGEFEFVIDTDTTLTATVFDNPDQTTAGTYSYRRQKDGSGLFETVDDEGSQSVIYRFDDASTGTFELTDHSDTGDRKVMKGNFDIGHSIPFASIENRALTITGNAYRDVIEVTSDDSRIIVTRNGYRQTFSRLQIDSHSAVIVGLDDGNDSLDASGLASNAIIAGGGGGDDTILGSSLDDQINGNAGRSFIVGNAGNDRLRGSNGRDIFYGGEGEDRLYGAAGNDVLDGGGNRNRIYGGDGDDIIIGSNSNDRLYGENGNDALFGKRGNDYIDGGNGLDIVDSVGSDTTVNIP